MNGIKLKLILREEMAGAFIKMKLTSKKDKIKIKIKVTKSVLECASTLG
jgi:hypothetical protein